MPTLRVTPEQSGFPMLVFRSLHEANGLPFDKELTRAILGKAALTDKTIRPEYFWLKAEAQAAQADISARVVRETNPAESQRALDELLEFLK